MTAIQTTEDQGVESADDLSPIQAMEAELAAQQAQDGELSDESGVTSRDDGLAVFQPSPALAKLVQRRLSALMKLDQLATLRDAVGRDAELPDNVTSELSKQGREWSKLPPLAIVEQTRERLETKLRQFREQLSGQEPECEDGDVDSSSPNASETESDASASDASGNPGESGDTGDSSLHALLDDVAAKGGEQNPAKKTTEPKPVAPPVEIDARYVRAIGMGLRQAVLMEERHKLTPAILDEASAATAGEPLRLVAKRCAVDCRDVFAWAAYMAAIERFTDGVRERSNELNVAIRAVDPKKEADKLEKLNQERKTIARLLAAAAKERRTVEPEAVDAYWALYRAMATHLCAEELPEDDAIAVRAMLRYGLLIRAPWISKPEITDRLLEDCRNYVRDWDYKTTATHVLYADEYIAFACKGVITPSLDENLELNEKGSNRWKADRLKRRLTYSKASAAAICETSAVLTYEAESLISENEQAESMMDDLSPDDSSYKAKRAALDERIQSNRVKQARLEQAIDLLTNRRLVEAEEAGKDSTEKLKKLGNPLPAEMIIDREVAAVRQLSRLCARLTEPFPPFTLRDYYDPDSGVVSDRPAMLDMLGDLESRDPRIFKEVAVPAKREPNRVYIRYSPYVVLMPCRGAMSMSWNPRAGAEVGRMAAPLFSMRAGMQEKALIDALSDFRYDTSKEAAGNDVLTSDTLVAAYATARWDWRKKSKEVREKAAIFNEERDRMNWRRHYQLYMASAMDGGKKLFFKNSDVYEAVCKYIGMPDGIERLKAS